MGRPLRASECCIALGLMQIAVAAPCAFGAVNLEFRPMDQQVAKCTVVQVGLYAVSDNPEQGQLISAVDVIVGWDPTELQMLPVSLDGAPNWLLADFLANDPYGLNEVVPPQDGDGIFTAFAGFGAPVEATPQGTLLATFQLRALEPSSGSVLEILESAGNPTGYTVVFDGTVPNTPVTGTLGSAQIVIGSQTCMGDLDGNCAVDLGDLSALLSNFGTAGGATLEMGDINGDGNVDLADLSLLLEAFGTACE